MPYTLKIQQIAVKDPDTGVYSGVDVLTEQTTEGLLNEIEVKGTTVKNEVDGYIADARADIDQLEIDANTLVANAQAQVVRANNEVDTLTASITSAIEDGVDRTLSRDGVPADAAACGDLKSTIYGESASISADRFTPINFSINTASKWTTLSGSSTAGVFDISECKKIVITPRAGVTNVWAFLNTATASDGAIPDFSDGYQGRMTSNTSTPVEYVITGNMHYLYVLKTGSTGSNVYPESIEMAFKIVTDSTLKEQYIPADAKATGVVRDSLFPVYSNLNPFGVMPLDGWRQGTYKASGEFTAHSRRITSDYIDVKGGSIFLPEFHTAEKILAFHCNFFTSEKVFISMESTDHTPTNPNGYVICPDNAAYLSVTLRPLPDTENITPDDVVYCGIRLVMQTFPQKSIDLSVMTYNVGHWGYGTASGIPSDIYDEKLLNLRHFFAKEKADVIGMQEFNGNIDREGTIRTNNVLFDAFYPYKQDTGMWESIKSKYPFAFSGNAQMTDDRWYSYALTQIGEKQIYLLCVHLIPNLNHEDRSADRLAEAQEIISMIKTGDSFNYSTIVFGDFNPEPDEEDELYKVFTDAGMSIANCGWFGKMFTAATNRSDLETGIATDKVWYIDNVIVSPDISIVNANPLYVYSDLVSDHIPLKVDLSFT